MSYIAKATETRDWRLHWAKGEITPKTTKEAMKGRKWVAEGTGHFHTKEDAQRFCTDYGVDLATVYNKATPNSPIHDWDTEKLEFDEGWDG